MSDTLSLFEISAEYHWLQDDLSLNLEGVRTGRSDQISPAVRFPQHIIQRSNKHSACFACVRRFFRFCQLDDRVATSVLFICVTWLFDLA